MDREKYVGVIVSFTDEDGEKTDYILISFKGEGNDKIVFGVAPLSDPKHGSQVVAFAKPFVPFDMSVLHHSLRIAENLFPNHPLLMAPAQRMERLTEEMLARIVNEGCPWTFGAYRDMVQSTAQVLAYHFEGPMSEGTLAPDFLEELPGIRPMLDDNLALWIESYLEDDKIAEQFRSFFEHCLAVLRKTIAEWKRQGEYVSLAQNRPFRLLGLHLENFVSFDELLSISQSPQLVPPLSSQEVAYLGEAVATLHFRAASHEPSEADEPKSRNRQRALSAAMAAARYQDALASKFEPGLEHIQGDARAWLARTMLLDGRREEALREFENALAVLTTNQSLPRRHDVLLDIAALVATSDPQRATVLTDEAQRIRREHSIRTALSSEGDR